MAGMIEYELGSRHQSKSDGNGPESASKVQVIYLAGDGRSGTTLLSRIVGSYAGCVAVGELYDIWIESLDGKRMCSCGDPLHGCVFWNAVMTEAFGELDRETIESIIELRTSVQSVRHVPAMMFPWMRTPTFKRRLREYVAMIERLYVAIQKVSGCDAIVDSSKLAAYAIAIDESKAIDVSFVHITRDSRACAYSWRRLKREPSTAEKESYLRQRALVRSSVVWALRNVTIGWVSRRFAVSAQLRYEDFVQQPRMTLRYLARTLGLDEHSARWVGEDEIMMQNESHIFAGNPNRVEQGKVTIRSDDEWRVRMSRGQIALVTVLTLPVLWKFGYTGTRGARPASPDADMLPETQQP